VLITSTTTATTTKFNITTNTIVTINQSIKIYIAPLQDPFSEVLDDDRLMQ